MILQRVGVDACSLGAHRTGVGNYIFPILDQLCAEHPKTQFFLYSNTEIDPPKRPNVVVRVSRPKLRGPVWQNTQLPQMTSNDDIQVLWATNGYLPLVGMGRVGTVLTIHDLVYRLAPQTTKPVVRWARGLVQRRCASAADALVCVSEATASDVRRLLGVNVHAVVHPVISERFRVLAPQTVGPLLSRYDLQDPYLLTVGTLEPRKNLATLLRAYQSVRKSGVELPPIVLVGGRGWLDAEIEASIIEAEQAKWIRRLGYVPTDDLPALYSGCQAFIMPSLYEGFGIPIQEAQRCGAPVMHGSHASMGEAAGGLGVTFTASLEGIAEALKMLAAQTLPLACRLPSDISHTTTQAAATMWSLLVGATKDRSA